MPKAILKFLLPEESCEFKRAAAGNNLAAALYELDNSLRNAIKYASEDVSSDFLKGAQFARDELSKVIEENDIGFVFDEF